MIPRILVLPGSLRTGSYNVSLAGVAALELARMGADVTRISLEDHPLPIIGQNLETGSGIPANAMKLARMIAGHDGLFVVSPEYNASIPPLLKNAIDWVSRVDRDGKVALEPFRGRTAALGAASNERFGGVRGLYHLRAVLMAVGAQVISEQCVVTAAAGAFDEAGELVDTPAKDALASTCESLIAHARAFGEPR